MKSIRTILAAFVLAALLLGACALAQPAAPAEQVKLRVAVLRIIDALPMYVAQTEGYFVQRGVSVELIPVGSAPERDQLVAAKQAEGMITEVLGVMYFNKDKVQVQAVRFARAATPQVHLFSILASQKSGITGVDGLRGVPVGISDGTIIAYLTDRMLEKEGLSPDQIKTVSVPSLSDRLTLLGKGEIAAATLPEPLTSLAAAQGAKVILDDSKYPDLSNSVITFRKDTLDEHPEAVRAFLAAIEDAVKKINEDPSKYQTLLSDQKIIPQPLQGKFQVPTFVTKGVPTQAQFDDMLAWAKQKGLLAKDIAYGDCVNPAFLP